jgi:methyl-accepting chemotaxis protein
MWDGVAVVADEVRKLAERAGAATNEIEAKITGILENTERAVAVMSVGNQRMQSTLVGADSAGAQLTQVIAESRRATELMSVIANTEADLAGKFSDLVRNLKALEQDMSSASETSDAIADAARTLDTPAQELDRYVQKG